MSAWEVVAAMGVFMLVTLPSAALIDYVQAKKKPGAVTPGQDERNR